MESQLYVRVRGRVLGPYDQEKLQSLARSAQLSRMHELSTDATNWVRASTYPELFVSENPALVVVTQPAAGKSSETTPGQAPPPPSVGRRWWYAKNGSEGGPVDHAALQEMMATGSLSLDDTVWTDGMAQWVPARQVPGLVTAPIVHSSSPGENDDLPASLCKSAANSRAWVLFVAIVSFVYAGLAIVGGILQLIQGANHHLAPVVASGLFGLIFAVDVAAGGFLLSSYASRVANLRYSSQAVVLEKALETLRTFWIYISINLIVFLTFLLFVVVWVIAIGGSLPWLQKAL